MTQEEKIELTERAMAMPCYNLRSQYGGYKPDFELETGRWFKFASLKEFLRQKHIIPNPTENVHHLR